MNHSVATANRFYNNYFTSVNSSVVSALDMSSYERHRISTPLPRAVQEITPDDMPSTSSAKNPARQIGSDRESDEGLDSTIRTRRSKTVKRQIPVADEISNVRKKIREKIEEFRDNGGNIHCYWSNEE